MMSATTLTNKQACLAIALIVAGVLGGCGSPPPFPKMQLDHCCGKTDPAADIRLPAEPALTNETVAASLTAAPPTRAFSRVAWRPTGRSQFDTARAIGFVLVHRPLDKGLSPYTGGSLPVVERLITATDKGRLYYTPPLNQLAEAPMKGLKYLSPDIFVMQSPHGTIGRDGTLTVASANPLNVAQSGYIVNVSMRGTGFTEQLAIPPRFTGLKYLDYSHPAARRGSDGYRGRDGSSGPAGSRGANGRSGADATSFGGNGSNGSNATPGGDGGRGGDGTRGGDGQSGQNSSDSAALAIKVIPLHSKFYSQPLARYQFQRGSNLYDAVLTWGDELKVFARGGAGGDGGDGGSGGNGGNGGPGGPGGSGGPGGRGGDGRPGNPGAPGRDATRVSPGASGGRGGDGGPGGRGGDGGNGARGGNGGPGGAGGDGGTGGDGGNGGRGAAVTVTIAGNERFASMAKAALKIDVSGGRGGDGGAAGAAGRRGDGGPGGHRGYAGGPGEGGSGGPGGPGGRGGRSFTWVERRADPNRPGVYYNITHTQPGGSTGQRGFNGRRGPNGSAGMSGNPGSGGPDGRGGSPGRPGRNGADGAPGQVSFATEPTSSTLVSGDIRMVQVSDGRVVAAASCRGPIDELPELTRQMATKLKGKIAQPGMTVAVTVFRDRSQSAVGSAVAEELSVKVSAALVDTDWFTVRERLYLKELLEERDLDLAGLVRNPEARKQLGGVEYIIVGSVSVETR